MLIQQLLLFQAANYLDIKGLLDVTCKTVANMIKGKSPEEIRKTFNIKNDFTPAEEEQVSLVWVTSVRSFLFPCHKMAIGSASVYPSTCLRFHLSKQPIAWSVMSFIHICSCIFIGFLIVHSFWDSLVYRYLNDKITSKTLKSKLHCSALCLPVLLCPQKTQISSFKE